MDGEERPPWVQTLRDFLNDGIYEPLDDDDDDEGFEVADRVVAAAMAVVCDHYGHYVIDDHCLRPDHRLCNGAAHGSRMCRSATTDPKARRDARAFRHMA